MEYYRSEEKEEVGMSEEKITEENWKGKRLEEKDRIDKKTEKII